MKPSLPALTCFSFSYPPFPAYTHIFFLKQSICKTFGYREIQTHESSDCQPALFSLSYSIRRPCDRSQDSWAELRTEQASKGGHGAAEALLSAEATSHPTEWKSDLLLLNIDFVIMQAW